MLKRYLRRWAPVTIVFVAALVILALLVGRASGLAAFGSQISVDYSHSGIHVRGQVLNAGGSPGGGASLLVSWRTWYGGGGGAYVTRTDGRGRYNVWVPPGPSRLITIVAGSQSVREVRELVHPRVWMGVVAKGHGKLLFRGGIAIDHHGTLPTVMLQDLTSHGWATFGAIIPSSRSHLFRYVLRNAPRGPMFSFRAVTLQNNAWMPGYSSMRRCAAW